MATYYLIETSYVGPNPDQHTDDDVITIETEPAHGNMDERNHNMANTYEIELEENYEIIDDNGNYTNQDVWLITDGVTTRFIPVADCPNRNDVFDMFADRFIY